MKNLSFILILAVALFMALAAGPAISSPFVSPFCSPISPLPGTAYWLPGRDYLFESRAVITIIKDQGHTGATWFIGDELTPPETIDRFCRLITWADDTAACCQGPGPTDAEAIRRKLYLPVLFKSGRHYVH